jgi:hypothetical protein
MRAVWELARCQLGLITWAQAIQLVTEDEFRTALRRGDLERFRRGVYVVAGAPRTYEQAVLAAVLAAGDQAWASHRTAARLYGLKVPTPTAIDILTLPSRRLHIEGIDHHRNQVLPMRDLGRAGVVPATTVAKTLVDCTPWLPGRRLTQAIDDARRRKLVTYEEVELAHAELDKGRRTGRHLVIPLRPVVADRHDAGGSDRELDVRGVLRRAGLPLPLQQHPVFVAGRWRFLDHAYPEPLIYLEFDGFAEHGEIRETFDDDRERDAELALLGWLGIRYTSNTRPADLVSRVRRALEARAARVVDGSRAICPRTLQNP